MPFDNRKRSHHASAKPRLKIESIEPRLLFSADLPAVLPAWHPQNEGAPAYTEQLIELVSANNQLANASVIPSNTATTVVIVDPATPDYQKLVDDINQQDDSVAIYLLSAESDGITQISAIIANHGNVGSLQIISHGKDGQIDLGSSSITSISLLSRADEISQWRDRFNTDADILIYGCDLAATETGEQFVNALGYLTSTDVAASDDITGSALSGADWVLEYSTGSIESEFAVSQKLQNDYIGVLATVTVTTTLDANHSGIVAGNPLHTVDWLISQQVAGDISLREAIVAANNTNSGTTTISLGAGTYAFSITGADGNDSSAGDLDIWSNIEIIGSGVGTTSISADSSSRVFEVHTGGSLSLTNMQISNGAGASHGGAVYILAGAAFTANNVGFTNNTATNGGAIFNAGIATLSHVSASLNNAVLGGAIYSTGSLTLNNATIDQNDATLDGGGIFATASANAFIVNTTVSGNAAGDIGGGIYIDDGAIINSTITNNTAETTGGIDVGTPTVLQNVIVANNVSNDGSSADYAGSVISNGGNVIEDTSVANFTSANDITGVDPLLGVLQDNGGSSLTHAMLPGSVGIDNGVASGAPATDQRGFAREGEIDSGAFEFISNSAPTTTGLPSFSVNEDHPFPTVDLTTHFMDAEDGSANLTYTIDNIADPAMVDSPFITSAGILILPLVENANGGTSITITATDSGGESVTSTFLFFVNPINDLPVVTSNSSILISENIEYFLSVTSTDVDGNAPVYSLVAGEDSARFSINEVTGALSFAPAADAENPTDIGADNIYNITVNVDDGFDSVQQAMTIAVVDVYEAPIGPVIDQDAASNQLSEGAAAGSFTGIHVSAIDPDLTDSEVFSLDNNAGGLFTIDQNTGVVTVAVGAVLDREIAASHTIDVRATSTDGSTSQQSFTIDVLDVNDNTPVIAAGQSFNIGENSAASTLLGSVLATDADSSSVLQNWTIVNGNATGVLQIDSATGEITIVDAALLDFELNQNYTLGVSVSDGLNTSNTQIVVINVLDVNEPPQFTTIPTTTATQDAPYSQLIETTDPEGTSAQITANLLPSWLSLVDNLDGTATISGTATNADVGSHNVILASSDGTLKAQPLSFTIDVANVNDLPVINFPTMVDVDENTTTVGTITSTDIDGDALTYSLAITGDSSLFSIDSTTGELSFITPADAENPLDIGADNTYNISVQVNDASPTTVSHGVAINVTNINERPAITSTAPAMATEGIAFSHTLSATDPDNDSLLFSAANLPSWLTLTDNANANGTATLQGIPANGDVGINSFTVELSDGHSVVYQPFDLDVTNVNDLPDITFPSDISINENTILVGTVTSNDIDGASPLYSLASTGDYQRFSIDAATGTLSFIVSPDAENAADINADNTYLITIQVSDGSAAPVSKNVVVRILDVNEFDVSEINDANTALNTIIENSVPGTTTGITATAADYDISDSVSYSLLQNNNGLFSINIATGEISLSTTTMIDYERAQSHEVVVQAISTDGSTSTQTINIVVGDANDNAPVLVAGQQFSILENATSGQPLNTVIASDIDTVGPQQAWSLVGGNDQGIFSIDPFTGELSLSNAGTLDFEQAQEYALQVQVSDGQQSATQLVSVVVLDVNEPPVINNTQHTSVEGVTGQIGSINITDPESNEITSIEIVGGSGQAAFEIVEGDQIVQVIRMAAGVYTLDVIVTDSAGLTSSATLTIRIIAFDGAPLLGGAEPNSATGVITGGIEPNNSSSGTETAELNMQGAAGSESAGDSYTTGNALTENVDIVDAAAIVPGAVSIVDSRFEGSQPRDGIRHDTTQASEGSHPPSKSTSTKSVASLVMDLLLQDSENLMRGFNIDLDTINTSITLTPALLHALSDMSNEIDSMVEKSQIKLELAIKAGTVVSVTLTVGYITWLMQAGAFLTTALSTAPLWRSLDPIPVLISSNSDDDGMEQISG
ncbi:MAG: cadherin domain-containing protein [Granulosicoccaceae bacterium]